MVAAVGGDLIGVRILPHVVAFVTEVERAGSLGNVDVIAGDRLARRRERGLGQVVGALGSGHRF
jgi:hypothetical protein